MKRGLLILVVLPLLASGCLVANNLPRRQATVVSCHPSQHWDGAKCRHKGKGHGARKHDGDDKKRGKG